MRGDSGARCGGIKVRTDTTKLSNVYNSKLWRLLKFGTDAAVFAQLTTECRRACPSPSKLPIPIRGSEPPSSTCLLGSTQLSIPNGISIGQPFMHSSPQTVPILYNGTPSPKIAPSMGIWTPSNTSFLGPTRVQTTKSQTASRSLQPFCKVHGRVSLIPILYNGPPLSPKLLLLI